MKHFNLQMRLDINRVFFGALALSVFTHVLVAVLLARYDLAWNSQVQHIEVEILIEGHDLAELEEEEFLPPPPPTPRHLSRPQPTPTTAETSVAEKVEKLEAIEEDPQPVAETQESLEELLERYSKQPLKGRALDASERYAMELRRALNQKKEYPALAKRLRQRGRVVVLFVLKEDGTLLKAEVVEPSKFDVFNKAAESLIKHIEGWKPFPEELKDRKVWAFRLPLDYDI